MQATAASTGPSRTFCRVLQTPSRSAPRIASSRNTAEAGIPTIAATASERLRRLPGISGSVGEAAAESGTTVTSKDRHDDALRPRATVVGDLAHGPDRISDARAIMVQ